MITDIKAKIDQIPVSVDVEGDLEYVKMTKLGQLFTATWQERLLMAGKLWRFDIGTMAADGDLTPVTGGGAATTMLCTEPEFGIGVPAGYFLIPVLVDIAGQCDLDANESLGNALIYLDLAATLATDGTGATITPQNMLDGGGAFPGTCRGPFTGAATAATRSELLAYECVKVAGAEAAGLASAVLHLHYEPKVPIIAAGPCAMLGHWGGTKAVPGIATVVVACVPSSWFPTS